MLAYGTRRSEGVHDPIFHRIVALDDGDTRFVLISTDVAGISPAFHDQVVAELQAEVGLGLDQVWWTATHTHSGPVLGTVGLLGVMRPKWIERYGYDPNPEYSAWAKAGLLEGIRRAVSGLRPARLGLGTGQSLANINRRPLDLEGKAFLGKNPDGPVDRQIGLIRLELMMRMWKSSGVHPFSSSTALPAISLPSRGISISLRSVRRRRT